MTELRQSAIMELEKITEDKLSFVMQIMQNVANAFTEEELLDLCEENIRRFLHTLDKKRNSR